MLRRLAIMFFTGLIFLGTASVAHAQYSGFLYQSGGPYNFQLPPGSYVSSNGVLVGPHGGGLTQAENLLLETVVLPGGTLQVYAYDFNGNLIPVDALNLGRVRLQVGGSSIVVNLQPASNYYFVGYYDPFYYDRYFYQGYAAFNVFFPSAVIAQRYYRPYRYYDYPSYYYWPTYQYRYRYTQPYRYQPPRSYYYTQPYRYQPPRGYRYDYGYQGAQPSYRAPVRQSVPRSYQAPSRTIRQAPGGYQGGRPSSQ